MKSKVLYSPFEVQVSDLHQWFEQPLVYHFFELVQVKEGTGTRHVNYNLLPYSKGDIFIFTPSDCRGFFEDTPTYFCSIRFSTQFLMQCKDEVQRKRIAVWLNNLEKTVSQQNQLSKFIINSDSDAKMLANLFDNIQLEFNNKATYHQDNLQQMLSVMLNILVRNVTAARLTGEKEGLGVPLIDRILDHIHLNIGLQEKLRVEYIAKCFHLSVNYMGEYFRKLTGESLRDYIGRYRLKLVQQRLVQTRLTISEIAQEFGYSDESHMSRQFKKHANVSPTEFRKNYAEAKVV
jgi:YesN/AraC family two-component response regulator